MTNTQLLRDLISAAQHAGNLLRGQNSYYGLEAIDDVVVIAETLGHRPLLKISKAAYKLYFENRIKEADEALRTLIIKADRLLGRL